MGLKIFADILLIHTGVAAIQSVAQMALEAGNCPGMTFSNYRELVTPQDAKAWFDILRQGA